MYNVCQLTSSCSLRSRLVVVLLVWQPVLHQHNKVSNFSLTIRMNITMIAGVVSRDNIVITEIRYEITSLTVAVAMCSANKERAGGSTIQNMLKALARKRKKDNRTSAFLYVEPSSEVRLLR